MKIGSIEFGINTKKEFHDLSHDVNTTSDVGFCQPTLVQSVQPKSSISLQTKSFVRLAPMPCPTFGRLKVQQDTMFVPMTDVFEAFPVMMSGNTVRSPQLGGGSYAPKQADYISAGRLLDILFTMPAIEEDYSVTTFDSDHVDNIFKMFFRMGFEVNYVPGNSGFASVSPSDGGFLPLAEAFKINTQSVPGAGSDLVAYGDFLNVLSDSDSFPLALSSDVSSAGSPVSEFLTGSTNYEKSIFAGISDFSYFKHCFLPYNKMVYGSQAPYLANGLSSAYAGIDKAFIPYFDLESTSQNADFVLEYVPKYRVKVDSRQSEGYYASLSFEDISSVSNYQRYRHRITFTLTPFGKRFFKILNSVGVNFRFYDAKVEVNKLFAYYKAWFDLYNPNRVKQWFDTSAYFIIHRYYDYYENLEESFDPSDGDKYRFQLLDYFKQFILDCSKCVYYLDADPITVATPTNLLKPQGEAAPAADAVLQNNVNDPQSTVVYDAQNQSYPVADGFLSGLTIKMLEKLYYLANKESVLASNIADYMRARYGVDIRSTRRLGSDDFYCQISDIMGTVNNEQTALGEYAGKGIGSGDTKTIKFDIPEQGYIIQLTSVVPFGGYVQANSHPQIKKEEFFDETWDSTGQEPLPYSEVFARESVMNNFRDDFTFGMRPYYFGLKYRNNVANGGFSFRSERANFLPYSLDRVFSEGDTDIAAQRFVEGAKRDYTKPILLTASENLRSIGLYETYGNYDRIFYDTTGITDNFIVHILQDVKYYAPMKPIRRSFDTYDPDTDDGSTNVDHA